MKTPRVLLARPRLLLHENSRVRGPGGERIAKMTTVAMPSPSVTTGELLLVIEDGNTLIWLPIMLEETPLTVKTNESAAS